MTYKPLSPSRRALLLGAGALGLGQLVLPRGAAAQSPLKVAGIYTVPVEQQWVSRIHIAAEAAKAAGEIEYTFTENVANTDYPRVMREYAEQARSSSWARSSAWNRRRARSRRNTQTWRS